MKKLFSFLTIAVLMASCNKYNNEVPANGRGTIKFAINPLSTGADGGRLAEVAEPSYLSFTVTNDAGETVSDIINVYGIEQTYFTSPYLLPTGDYSLEEFIVLDNQEEVLYLAPLEGSPLAEYVAQPLPLSFSVGTDQLGEIPLHVLSVDDHEPAEFGFSTFQFKPLEIREIPVVASTIDETLLSEISYSVTVQGKDTLNQAAWSKTYELTSPGTIKVPIGYDQYKITANAGGYVPQIKYFRGDFFYSNIATIDYLTFELIPVGSEDVVVLESNGFKFYVSADPCNIWGRVEMPEEYVYEVEFIRWYKIGVDADDEYVGDFFSPGGLIGYPALMTNFDNLYDWERPFTASEDYCSLYLHEEYQDQLELVTLEKGLLIDFDWDGTESALEDYDVHLIHAY